MAVCCQTTRQWSVFPSVCPGLAILFPWLWLATLFFLRWLPFLCLVCTPICLFAQKASSLSLSPAFSSLLTSASLTLYLPCIFILAACLDISGCLFNSSSSRASCNFALAVGSAVFFLTPGTTVFPFLPFGLPPLFLLNTTARASVCAALACSSSCSRDTSSWAGSPTAGGLWASFFSDFPHKKSSR